MKNFRKTAVLFALAASLCSMTIGYAQPNRGAAGFQQNGQSGRPDMPPPGDRGLLNPRALERLGLSDTQKTQIRAFVDASRADSQTYFDRLAGLQDQLKAVVQAATFNEQQARSIIAQKTAAQTELEIIRLRTDSAVYNLLTAEQKAQLDQLNQQRPDFPPGGGHRPGGRPQ